MGIIRSVTTKHTVALNIEFRVGIHNPSDSDDGKFVVVEVYYRESHGDWSIIGSYRMEDFIEMNRDIVRIAGSLLPEPTEDEDNGTSVR